MTPRKRLDGKTCKLPGCKRPMYAKDLCDPHYRRDRLYGDPHYRRPVGGPRLVPPDLDAAITRRQRELWVQHGYVKPERTTSGRYQWTQTEVDIAILMARIALTGLPLETAAKVARAAVVKGKKEHALVRGLILRVNR